MRRGTDLDYEFISNFLVANIQIEGKQNVDLLGILMNKFLKPAV